MDQLVALVAIENIPYSVDVLYSYNVPKQLEGAVSIGCRVLVSFGKGTASKRQGVVFKLVYEQFNSKYKSISAVLDEAPLLSEEAVSIAEFLKERTFCTFFEGIKVQLPVGFFLKLNSIYVAIEGTQNLPALSKLEERIYKYMLQEVRYFSKQEIIEQCQLSDDGAAVERLVSKGYLKKDTQASTRVGNLSVKTAVLNKTGIELENILHKLTAKQREIVNVLCDIHSASVKELCGFTGTSVAVINTLEKRGIVKFVNYNVYRSVKTTVAIPDAEPIVLTEQQEKAYSELSDKYKSGGGVALLYGITGSGKTSVFMKLIDFVLESGRKVIVMVPEISLTMQVVAAFKSRFGSEVAILHSGLSIGERKDEYRRITDGNAKIVVGTRSAVFAPLDNIGLIVIDEEQEHTYKSESTPRYHARDVAKMRIKKHKGLLVLSSATPSIESYSLAQNNTYSIHRLTERFGDAVLPNVSIVDMKQDRQRGNKYSISLPLTEALQNNLAAGKQSILLINRRGYNTFAVCDNCGQVVTCPYCSISMTFHLANKKLMCHYCGYTTDFKLSCDSCKKNRVRYCGYGTQRIEEELSKLLPTARILRMDADTNSGRYDFEKNLSSFENHEYDIMLGTQMVAKGLNFKNVTLVGVVNADQQLNNDDYRSEEATFDLLTQVVGRAGRGDEKGSAIIQTMTPENNVIALAQQQDYGKFYESEIAIRRAMIYPPFCDICTVCLSCEDENKALTGARIFLEKLMDAVDKMRKDLRIIVLPIMPPRVAKINNKFRYRLVIKCKNNKTFRSVMSGLIIEFGKYKIFDDVTLTVDINPLSLV